MKNKNKIFFMAAAVAILAMVVSACKIEMPDRGQNGADNIIPSSGGLTEGVSLLSEGEAKLATQGLIKFQDVNELRQFLAQRAISGQSGADMYGIGRGGMAPVATMAEGAMELAVADSVSQKSSGTANSMDFDDGAGDYSQTNVQYENVDEGDFVKNDNRYIYMIADNKLVIVDAYDAENADIVSTTELAEKARTNPAETQTSAGKAASMDSVMIDIGYPDYDYSDERGREIFINGDKLMVITESSERGFYFPRYDIMPQPTYRQRTNIYIYDVSDRTDPQLSESFSMTGSYYQSRMIGDMVYIVTQDGVSYGPLLMEPMVTGQELIKPEIYYFDNPESEYKFNTIASIDMDNEKVVDSKTFMLGYANTLMVSENNIYIAYQKQNYWRWGGYWGDAYEKERFDDVILPLLPEELKTQIVSIKDQKLPENEEWQEISKVLSVFFTELDQNDNLQDQYQDVFETILDALVEYDTKKAMEDRKTVIHKIGIQDGMIDYNAKGEVDGRLLNQFSIDENQGYLRVATTVDVWARKRVQYNNVYVLDSGMKTIGELTGVAEDEQIYSTRFLGNKLYMVTFRQTDPFFVIDLSDPRNPKVLGELKIPGFSNYLHPYDENHIIGVGKETTEGDFGGVTTTGIKIALFDVTDVNDPQLVDKVVIGDSGSDSPVLYDHKAFLFSKEKNLLVLPITEVTERTKLSQYRYSNSIWHGAYVFKVTEEGIDTTGKVTHSSTKSEYWYWWDAASVMRSLYMDDNLYTISNKFIKINDLANNLEELNTVKLPYQENSPYYWR